MAVRSGTPKLLRSPTHEDMIRSNAPLALWLCLALAACQASEKGREQKVVEAARGGRYDVAVEEARRLAEAHPEDAALQALYLDTRVAALLDRGRDQVFAEDFDGALSSFLAAIELAPGHPMVASWLVKTKKQLASRWLDEAAENTGPEKLDQAEAAYERVLQYEPDNPYAIEGLAHVLLLKNYRAGQSKTYFDDGLSSFRELRLQNARRAFELSRHYRENDPAAARAEQVERLMIDERLAQAQTLEAEGHFFAARNEYRLVLLLDPTHAEGRAGFDRMDRETRATSALAQADMEIRRGELEEARETLAEAELLTEAQRAGLTALETGIEEKRLADLYAEAQRLTEDYRYPDAVALYAELLALAPDYQDAAQRKRTIEEFIRLAEDLYARALEAKDDATAEACLRQIQGVVWPEYKDVVERLQAIEARKPAAEEPAPADGEPR